MELNVMLTLAGGLAVAAVLVVLVLMRSRTAYLGPVKEELQKEKIWLRRGEYNAAMVKGRQNLELLLKLVAEKNGIQLDNRAKTQADVKQEEERQNQNARTERNQQNVGRYHGGHKKTQRVMTHQQFNRWLSENGYLDRVARWEMNQVRIIGNKAVHESYSDKDDAWNQFHYLEDILKTVTERSQNKHRAKAPVEKVLKQSETPVKQVPKKTEASVEKESEKAEAPTKKAPKKKKAAAKKAPKKAEASVEKASEKTEAPTKKATKKKKTAAKQAPKKTEPPVKKVPEKAEAAAKQEQKDQNTPAEKRKKPRRRRKKKPQGQQTGSAAASNSSGE